MMGEAPTLSGGFWNMFKFGFMLRPIFIYLYGVSFAMFLWKVAEFIIARNRIRKSNTSTSNIYRDKNRLGRFLYVFIILSICVLSYRLWEITKGVDRVLYIYQLSSEGYAPINDIITFSSDSIVSISYGLLNLCLYCVLAIWKRSILHRWEKKNKVE